MALEHILEKIDSEAQARARGILDKADAEKQKRLNVWKSKAEKDAGEISRQAEAEASRLVRQAGAEGRLEANKAMLRLKRKWLVRVTGAARERLVNKETKLYQAILEHMIAGYLDDETTGVIFSGDAEGRKMAEAVKKTHGLEANVSGRDEEPQGGMIIQKGQVTINLSFSILFEEVSSRFQTRVHAILSGDCGE